MATKKQAELQVNIKTKGEKKLGFIRKAMSKIVVTAGDLVNAFKFIGNSLIDFTKKAAEFQTVERSFEQLAASQGQRADEMLAKMKELSEGTVSRLELMKNANTALLLGLPVERFGDMLKIARSASEATGQSMQFMLQSIVTGLGRGSKLILDNLGIMVNITEANEEYARALGKTASALSDSEKKQAFINKALSVGKANADKMASSSDKFKTNLERLEASIEDTSTALGTRLLPVGNSIVKLFDDIVKGVGKAFEKRTLKDLNKEMDVLKEKQKEVLERNKATIFGIRLFGTAGGKSVQIRIDALQKLIDAEEAAEEKRALLARKGARTAKQLREVTAVDEAIAVEDKRLLAEEAAENDKLFKQALRDEELAADIRLQEDQIRNEQNAAQKLQLIDRLNFTKQKAINEQRKKNESDLSKFKRFLQSEEVKGAQNVFGRISTLQQSQSKGLIAIGKAAAIANIAISTAAGIMKSIEIFGIPFGIPFAAAVAAAGAVQTAKVAGVNLQEGGIVPATQGGVQATIAEGGQDEAVIPLPEGAEGLGGTTINITAGAFVGDADQAREFAIMIDQELFELRQENASVSFEEAIT